MSKKSIMAGASVVAALGAVALPFAAWAEPTTGFTDQVQISISASCGLTQDNSDVIDGVTVNGLTAEGTVSVGTTHEWSAGEGVDGTGNTVRVVCNDQAGWSVYARGASTDSTTTRADMVGTGENTSSIKTLAYNETLEQFPSNGKDSKWAFMIQGVSTPVSVVNSTINYGNWAPIPTSYTKVVTSDKDTSYSANTGQFSTAYKVYVGTAQAADTYTGKVSYVLVHPASQTAPTD